MDNYNKASTAIQTETEIETICLQDALNTILAKEGLEPQTLYRSYQIQDNKRPDGTEVKERWRHAPEISAQETLDRFGAMFATVCATTYRKDLGDVSRSDALYISDTFAFDFDSDSIDQAIASTNRFVDLLIGHGVNPLALEIYASGGRGFHVMVPVEVFIVNGVQGLTLKDLQTFHHLNRAIAQALYVDGLDMNIYTAGRMWRRANLQRSNGNYKVPLPYYQLKALEVQGYADLISAPRPVCPRVKAELSGSLARIASDARRGIDKMLKDQAERAKLPKTPLSKEVVERYQSALNAIDPDTDYQTWFSGVAATHHLFDGSTQGFDIADEWSQRSRLYDKRELETSWDGLGDALGTGGITEATVFAKAQAFGWVDPAPHLNPNTQVGHPQYRLRLTDEGMAEHFAQKFMCDLKYIAESKSWVGFDGRSWVVEDGGLVQVKDRVKTELRCLQQETISQTTSNESEEAERAKRLKFLINLENGRRLETIINKMAAEADLNVNFNLFDDRPYLINLINGTYDLKKGELRAHDPNDFLTKRVNITYDAEAKCPRWVQFIDEITLGDKELAKYLQCIVGLCLSGDVTQQEAYIMYGSGANGKSTFTEIISILAGDYYRSLGIDVLMYSNRTGSSDSSIASIRGARVVATGELPRGVQLKSNVFKDLTGGDEIQTSDKWVRAFTFRPQCKILIPTNFLPTITDQDHGTWRRTRIIPFKASFKGADRDNNLDSKLKGEIPGILNWALKGFQMFLNGEMQIPTAVQALTNNYRQDLNVTSNFVKDWLEQDPKGIPQSERGRVTLNDMYVLYREYCQGQGLRPLAKRQFREDITEIFRDVETTHWSRIPVYWGFKFKSCYIPENILLSTFKDETHREKSVVFSDENLIAGL